MMKLRTLTILLALAPAVAACGDDSANPFVFDAGAKDATTVDGGKDGGGDASKTTDGAPASDAAEAGDDGDASSAAVDAGGPAELDAGDAGAD